MIHSSPYTYCSFIAAYNSILYLGKLLTEISSAEDLKRSHVYDLSISGNTLIVPRCTKQKVMFYQID